MGKIMVRQIILEFWKSNQIIWRSNTPKKKFEHRNV